MSQRSKEFLDRHVQDDRQYSLRKILQKSEKKLIEALLDIQEYVTSELRSFDWAEELICLRIPNSTLKDCNRQAGGLLQQTVTSLCKGNFSYAAVSYCCEPSNSDNDAVRNYSVEDIGFRQPRTARVRDEVLDRAIEFVQYHGLDGFWIDEECLDKSDYVTHQKAIHGMDLVYRKSRKNLGLLDVPMRTEQDIHLLDQFLQARFVETNGARGHVRLVPNTCPERLHKLAHLLDRILSDRWWQRCWIFQENYCSTRMMLLLPYDAHTTQAPVSKKIRYICRDIQISAREFQIQLSLFCLAIHRENRLDRHPLWPICFKMLKKARRYDILYKYQGWTIVGTSSTPMSALIFADVCEREIKCKDNIPAIVANCCDYTRRVRIPHNPEESFSLSLLLVALFLLNGEMFTYHSPDEGIFEMTVAEFLVHQSFGQSILPVAAKELTFLKRRRWPGVELTKDGMRTRGHIWRVDRYIVPDREPCSFHFGNGRAKQFLRPFERARLRQLSMWLRQAHPGLSHKIDHYLEEMAKLVRPYGQRAYMMRNMTRRICQAMKKGRRLLIGASVDSGSYCGIFVCPRPSIRQPINIVTSWEAGQQIECTANLRAVEKYMCLEVEQHLGAEHGPACWVPKGWINGLCFFKGMRQQSILIPWPDHMRFGP